MKPRAHAVGLLCCIVVAGMPARAALMHHTDLTSLCIESDAVVLAERGAQRTAMPGITATAFRVLQVYAGPLHPGDSIEVLDPEYAMSSPISTSIPRTFDAATTLFLQHPPSGYAVPPGGPYWATVPSGMRVTAAGHVYRFVQESNPGLYVPAPQGHDPDDARGYELVTAPVTRNEFHAQLAAALTHADAYRAAPRESDSARRREALLALLPPAQDPPSVAPEAFDGPAYRDELARSVVRRLQHDGDRDGVLDAVSRVGFGLDAFTLGFDASTAPDLIATATRGSAPVRLRVAAVRLLTEVGRMGTDPVRPTLLALLRDPLPAIRAAAALALGADHDHAAQIEPALRTAWLAEADGAVRYALLRCAQLLFANIALPARAGVREPSCAARRVGARAFVGCVGSGSAAPTLEQTTLVATPAGRRGTPVRTPMTVRQAWASAGVAGWLGAIAFAPRLAAGTYTLRIEARAAMPGAAPVPTTMNLGAWTEGTGAAPSSAVSGLRDVATMNLGTEHSCALRADHNLLCWGDNSEGKIGDGSNAARLVPTLVH